MYYYIYKYISVHSVELNKTTTLWWSQKNKNRIMANLYVLCEVSFLSIYQMRDYGNFQNTTRNGVFDPTELPP